MFLHRSIIAFGGVELNKTPDSQITASQTYRDKMVSAGYKQIALWVPVEKVEQVKEYAKKLKKEGLNDEYDIMGGRD